MTNSIFRFLISPTRIIAALATAVAVSGPAAAVPQILGLVATHAPVPLTCEDGMCSAQFSGFCMQADRRIPNSGRAYRPGPGTKFTLSVTDEDGKRHEVAITHAADIVSIRAFHAVKISVPESAVKALGGSAPALSVAERSAAVPVKNGEELKPLGEAEIARVTGMQRQVVDARLPPNSAEAVAVATLNRLINAMPAGADALLDGLLDDDSMASGDVWQKLFGAPSQTAQGPGGPGESPLGAHGNDASLHGPNGGTIGPNHPGRKAAKRMYDYCKGVSGSNGFGPRECLIETHDHKTLDITREAWEAEKLGM